MWDLKHRPLVSRSAAIGLLALLVAVVVSQIMWPLAHGGVEAVRERQTQSARLKDYEGWAAKRVDLTAHHESLSRQLLDQDKRVTAEDISAAATKLRTDLTALADDKGMSVQTIQPLSTHIGALGERFGFQLKAEGSINQIEAFLSASEHDLGGIYFDRLWVSAGQSSKDERLKIGFDAYGYIGRQQP